MRTVILLGALTMLAFITPALAQDDGPEAVQLVGELRGTVDYVHHEELQLVIDDKRFTMPLNFKVSDAKGKTTSRFAVKVGQSVEYHVRYDEKSNIFYVDWLKLLN